MLKHGHDFRIVNTARGCPYPCAFCTVNKVFGSKIRMRPIDDVVRDVDAIPGRMYINGDENIWWLGKIDRAIELFTALRGSKKKWMGFGSLAPVLSPEGPRMLEAARKAGMLTVWVGWESMTAEGLESYRADRKVGDDRERAVKTLKDHGIDVSLFFMLGSRADSLRRLPARGGPRRPARRLHAPFARRPVPRHRAPQAVRAVPLQGPGLGVLHRGATRCSITRTPG